MRAEIAKAEDAISRYFGAFEAGTMTTAQCRDRVNALDARLSELRLRQHDLETLTAHPTPKVPTVETLGEIRSYVEQVMREGTAPEQKAILQALVEEVRVVSRDHIDPAFRAPRTGKCL